MLRDVLNWLCVKQGHVNIDFYPTQALCSLASLPDELYQFVLARVFLYASPNDHQSLLLVCKTWNDAGRNAPLALRPNKLLPLALIRGFPKVASLDFSVACEVQDERLPCFAGLENLVALKLERCREITDAGLAHLLALTQLQSLDLARCPLITDIGLVLLCRHLTQLRTLNIKCCYAITSNGLSELSALTALTAFVCTGCQGLRYEALGMMGQVTTLKALKLSNCPAAICQGIEPLFRLTALKYLLLDTEEALLPNSDELLMGVAQYLTQLIRLDVTLEPTVSEVGFEALRSLRRLESLHLRGHGLMEKRIFNVVAALHGLRTFQLCDKGAGDCAVAAFSTLHRLRSLTIKRLSDASFLDDHSLDALSRLTHLTELVLWKTTSLTGFVVSELTSLQELYLNCCPLLESWNMNGFSRLVHLRVLVFEYCDRLDDGIVHALQWIPALEQLHIFACHGITGRSFGALAQLTELSTLVFQFCRGITDNAFKQLTLMTSLRRLEVVMCPQITEDGIRVLLNGDLVNLEYLSFSGCHAPKLTTQLFRNKLPKFRKLVRNAVNLSMSK